MSETYDMYDEFDCEVEKEAKTMKVKEKDDSETDCKVLESVDQSAVVKTEEQTESAIDMFDDEFHAIMEQDFSAGTNANEASEAVMVEEEHETDSDATEIDEDDHSAVNEFQQNTEPVVNRSPRSASGEQQLNGRRRRAKRHKCQQCDKSFDRPYFLKRHQLVHTGIKAHKCSTCSKSFARKAHLKEHQLVHTGIKAHQCPICSKSFGQKSALKLHQLVHTGIRAHECTKCSKSFGQKGTLTKHQQVVHSDFKPFQCSICEKTFKWKHGLKDHLHTQHQQQ